MAAKPRVVWVSFAPLDKAGGRVTSSVASVRYRITLPARALESEGFESRVTQLGAGANRRTLLERFAGASAVVFGKLLAPPAEYDRVARDTLDLVAELRSRAIPVLADYSDDLFSDPLQGTAQRTLAGAVDRVVASTPQLAGLLKTQTSAPVSVVGDPVEGARGEPRVRSSSPFALLWFGHPVNLDTLRRGLAQLERVRASIDYSLTLVTAPGAGAETIPACRFRAWSTAALFDELARCDAVVIPSNPHDPRKAVKSPNRFTESVWAGRFVLAHALPGYQALADCGWVGEDLGEGLQWYASHPEEARQRIAHGQAAVAARFTPAAIAREWSAAIRAAMEKA
jgi:glycosyltransferase involved in cell wall biosynthesis